MRNLLLAAAILLPSVLSAQEQRVIHVFVALCDNATQGIIKVGAKIGNGDDPANNLYWGCSDGMKLYFKNSPHWKLAETTANPADGILERLTFTHKTVPNVTLIADGYRGAEMKKCLETFFQTVASGDDPARMVAFIGHNGLMDTSITLPTAQPNAPRRDVAVLACVSRSYFTDKLTDLGARPILMTEQLMYPGSFLLHDALEGWLRGESVTQLRERAAKAYARNQGISVKGARGVFSNLAQTTP